MIAQGVLALCWIFAHIAQLPLFGETEILIKASQNGVIDEYTGALYVGLIAIFRWVERLLGIPFQSILYLLQLAMGLSGVYTLLRVITGRKKWQIWMVAVYVNTIPFLLQAHFSVLPYSLAGSVYLALAGVLLQMNRVVKNQEEEKGKRALIRCGIRTVLLWTLSGLVMPEYYLLSGSIVVLSVLYVWIRARIDRGLDQKVLALRGSLFVIVMSGAVLCGVLCLATSREGAGGRMQNSVQAQAVRRLAWPEMFRMNELWSPEIRDTFSLDELQYYSVVPERMINEFGPALEAKYGKEKANQIYSDTAYIAITTNTKAVAKQLLTDFCFYICPPVAVGIDLEGLGGTYTGWNYEELQKGSVVLTELYTSFGRCVFGLLGVIALLRVFFCEKRRLDGFRLLAAAVVMQAVDCMWLTGGMVNYLRCPVNLCLWGIAMGFWLLGESEIGGEEAGW